MARWEGFEPPTPWFVARYSIQLSYQRRSFLNRLLYKRGRIIETCSVKIPSPHADGCFFAVILVRRHAVILVEASRTAEGGLRRPAPSFSSLLGNPEERSQPP